MIAGYVIYNLHNNKRTSMWTHWRLILDLTSYGCQKGDLGTQHATYLMASLIVIS